MAAHLVAVTVDLTVGTRAEKSAALTVDLMVVKKVAYYSTVKEKTADQLAAQLGLKLVEC